MMLAMNNRVRRRIALAAKTIALLALAAWRTPFHLHLLKSLPAANATMSSAPGIRMPASRPAACAIISTQMPAIAAAARTPAPK